MIQTQTLLELQRQRRLDGKSLELPLQARLDEEGRCSPILARAIWGIAQEAFGQKLDQQADQLRLGQLLFMAVEAQEPAGKPVAACQKVTVRLTLDADKDDFVVRIQRGLDTATTKEWTSERSFKLPNSPADWSNNTSTSSLTSASQT